MIIPAGAKNHFHGALRSQGIGYQNFYSSHFMWGFDICTYAYTYI